jgi:PhnB protein
MWLYVEDSDAVFNRAVSEGATVQVPIGDQFWGDRGGAIADPAGIPGECDSRRRRPTSGRSSFSSRCRTDWKPVAGY